jgi:mannitol-1-/sugar-/sorbitol-6-phosphatase
MLFDMDGVLVSSIASVDRCWKEWAKLYSVPDADTFVVPHGVRAADVIRMLKPEFNDAEVAEGLGIIEDMEVEDTRDLTVLPGAKALLSSLSGEQWAIVTSATHRLALARLAAAGLPVPDRLISGDMVERGKPDPEPYRRGAKLLGLAAIDCVVVEDAPSGVGAGLAAGSRVLGVIGTHTPAQLASANWIVSSLDEIELRVLTGHLDLRFPTIANC